MERFIIVLLTLIISYSSYAAVRLPKIISDNMVLQRDKPIKIWGWAGASENITIYFKGQTKTVKADKSGKWMITLNAEPAGGPHQLTIKGKNTIILNDILIGEVWVCSGQSNMEMSVRSTNNAELEIQKARYPEIRQFMVQRTIASSPADDVKGGDWKICSPENVPDFTAVGYFFAREIYLSQRIPIGLINTSWGGTHSETWTSREAFEQSDEFKDMIASLPELDLEALSTERNEEQQKKLKGLNFNTPATGVETWKNPDYRDNQWNTMKLPGHWEEQGLADVDGTLWFRKQITIGPADAGKEGQLELGMIDDSDETFVNGIAIGSTATYNEKRKYKIPAGLLKGGNNLIAIRVFDSGGGGGIYGDPVDMKLTTSHNIVIPLTGNWSYNIEALLPGKTAIGPNSYPTLLFNAMINPLLNYSIRGALWYQGEANDSRAFQYRTAFPLMIRDWRSHWKQGDFPFYFVQLASFNAANGNSENGSTWAELREAQSLTLSLPNTGMAVTTDIGEAKDIHPRNKQDVGKRLAAIALNKVYNQHNVFSGPTYEKMRVDGNRIRISFTNVGTGFLVKDKYGYPKGFEIAGADQKFHYAKAWIEGNEVIVSADQVFNPVAVRFAWADYPEDANLFNKEGFPASPFRTDNWKGITDAAKFRIE